MKHAIAAVLLGLMLPGLMLGAVPAAAEQAAALDEQQRARISQSVAKLNIAPLLKVSFAVDVGSEIPRSIKLRPLPYAAVTAAPQYRGHAFVRVEENVVIVEPRSYRIVAVVALPSAANNSGRKLHLTKPQRELIHAQVGEQAGKLAAARRGTTGSGPQPDIVVGEAVPKAYTIERFPDAVYWQVPALRSYQYILREKDLYLVDPRKRRVIELIE